MNVRSIAGSFELALALVVFLVPISNSFADADKKAANTGPSEINFVCQVGDCRELKVADSAKGRAKASGFRVTVSTEAEAKKACEERLKLLEKGMHFPGDTPKPAIKSLFVGCRVMGFTREEK